MYINILGGYKNAVTLNNATDYWANGLSDLWTHGLGLRLVIY